MHTLAQLGDFIGLPQGWAKVARYDGPATTRLATAGLLVSTLDERQRGSLRALIDAVHALPPITLEAKIVGPRRGYGGRLVTTVRLNACPGAVWHTRVHSIDYTGRWHGGLDDFEGRGGDVTVPVGAGRSELIAVRAGLSPTGPVELKVSAGFVEVLVDDGDPPVKPPPVKPPPVRPTCTVETDLAVPMSDATVGIKVHGVGFGEEEDVVITMDGDDQRTPRSDKGGSYSDTFSITRANPPKTRTFVATGQTTRRQATGGYRA